LSWFNSDALEGLDDEAADILSQSEAVEAERQTAIVAGGDGAVKKNSEAGWILNANRIRKQCVCCSTRYFR